MLYMPALLRQHFVSQSSVFSQFLISVFYLSNVTSVLLPLALFIIAFPKRANFEQLHFTVQQSQNFYALTRLSLNWANAALG